MKTALLLLVIAASINAQTPPAGGRGGGQAAAPVPAPAPAPAPGGFNNPGMSTDQVLKEIDDLEWRLKISDVADFDKVVYTSLPPLHNPNPTGPGAGNPLIVHAYTFIPKKLDRSKKQPLIVLIHGGVHSNFTSESAHIVRELLEQGYTIISTDYRGSTGYGQGYYREIDYGGREVDDVYIGMQWMLEHYSFLDSKRVGIVGWSHGGLITLMNIFQHPDSFAVAYAGVPVSDLVLRLGYQTDAYRAEYSAPYHIGKTVREDIKEYERRSPITYVSKLQTPLLIHTNTNDEDVNVLEVERLITALKAEGKKFEYKIYQDAPGGHTFNRLDTKLARESRQEIYQFLARHLKPGT
ncbi:MAG TPA: alpha/beta fold hydrolase [Bryobacteraceae bacterium]|nr:alpha/beta fold hydrolase [Bryobacteraceae bacterium]